VNSVIYKKYISLKERKRMKMLCNKIDHKRTPYKIINYNNNNNNNNK